MAAQNARRLQIRKHWKDRPSLILAVFNLLVAGILFGRSFLNLEIPPVLHRMELEWQEWKQSFIRYGKFSNPDFKPSSSVALIQLDYSNPVQFWFDTKTKASLAQYLQSYPGPFAVNLDPDEILRDPHLSVALKQNPKWIRAFRMENQKNLGMLSSGPEIPSVIAKVDGESRTDLFSYPILLHPSSNDYYEKSAQVGVLNLSLELTTARVFSFPLSLKGSQAFYPSLLLPLIAAAEECKDYHFARDLNELELLDCGNIGVKKIQTGNSLPLFYYRGKLRRLDFKKDYPADAPTLIVEVRSSSNPLISASNENTTYAEVLATALSNLKENHYLKESSIFKTSFTFFGIFLCALMFFSVFILPVEWVVNLGLAGILALASADFTASVFFYLKTELVPSLICFLALVPASILVRARLDFKNRNLVERALKGYVSEERLKKLLTGEESLILTGKKKILTCVLIDIHRFAKITENMSPEDTFKLMQRFFRIVDPIIFDHGGLIDKITGDGLLAIFGDSDRVEVASAAHSAVLAATEIQKTLSSKQQDLKVSQMVNVRIGVNSGSMIIGNAGSEKHFNYTVLGEAMNFTQRLEAACPPGEVLIGQLTEELVRPWIQAEPLEISAKNEGQKHKAYRVLQISSERNQRSGA